MFGKERAKGRKDEKRLIYRNEVSCYSNENLLGLKNNEYND